MPMPARIEYALRALAALAAAHPAPISASALAATQNLPPGYVYNVLADLRRVDLVYALRGHQGGYALSHPAGETTLGAVVRLLDGAPSADRAKPHHGPGTDLLSVRLHRLWEAANEAGLRVLDQTTIADLGADPSSVAHGRF